MWVLCFSHYKYRKSLSNHKWKTSNLEELWCGNSIITFWTSQYLYCRKLKAHKNLWNDSRLQCFQGCEYLILLKLLSIGFYLPLFLVEKIEHFSCTLDPNNNKLFFLGVIKHYCQVGTTHWRSYFSSHCNSYFYDAFF